MKKHTIMLAAYAVVAGLQLAACPVTIENDTDTPAIIQYRYAPEHPSRKLRPLMTQTVAPGDSFEFGSHDYHAHFIVATQASERESIIDQHSCSASATGIRVLVSDAVACKVDEGIFRCTSRQAMMPQSLAEIKSEEHQVDHQ